MEKLAWILVLLGNLGFCYPYASKILRIWGRKIPVNILKIVHALLIVYSPTVWAYIRFSAPLEEQTSSLESSVHLSYALGQITTVITEFIIRVSTVYYWEEILELFAAFRSLPLPLVKTAARLHPVRGSGKATVVLYVLGSVVFGVAVLCGTVEIIVKQAIVVEDVGKTAPESMSYLRLLFICTGMVDLLETLALAYSYVFVVLFGIILVNWHEDCVERLEHHVKRVSSKLVSHDRCSSNGSVLGKSQELGEIVEKFKFVRIMFTYYGKIAGCYGLAIVVNSVLKAIRFFGLSGKNSSPLLLRAAGTPLSNLWSLPVLFYFCNFGQYLESSVRGHQRSVHTLAVEAIRCQNKQLTQVVSWVEKWSWSYSACDLFRVNHSLILNSIATILTYFIFFIQLQTSEKFDPAKNSSWTGESYV